MHENDLDTLCVNTVRTLSMDAVQAADSGHPGTPMAMAPVAYTLWQQFLRFDPADPTWINRDRFVLSAGHASMLLYALLYLADVRAVRDGRAVHDAAAVSLDEIKRFRQLGSVTPGHPEYGLTAGVETTTGPLGQGGAVSVGMAIAGSWLAAHFNRSGHEIFDFNVYALQSDGDHMEGVTSEAASLAGHLRLSNLCWIYDNNHITIDGSTSLAFSDDMATRFTGYGWNVIRVGDANDRAAVARALDGFLATDDRPTLIVVDSHIAWGSPHKQDTSAAHGSPLGDDEVAATKRRYGWPEDARFLVPDGVREHFAAHVGGRGRDAHVAWRERFESWRRSHPDLAIELDAMLAHRLPDGWDADLPAFDADPEGMATRKASGKVINAFAPRVPWFVQGAADLAASTKTTITDGGDYSPSNRSGRNLHFGIREHGMGAICNGLAHCGLRPCGSTFLIFSDYMRPPMRLAALMELPVLYAFTHDSIGLGEDGPTHQAVEQLAGLRAVPGFTVIRPADANEVTEAWRVAMETTDHPVALVLTRQKVPVLDRTRLAAASGLRRGAYVLADPEEGEPEVLLLATGSEVFKCVAAYEKLADAGVRARVVSMPSWEIFDRQGREYRDEVLPPRVTARVAVEQAAPMGWERYAGMAGAVIAMETFGASAPRAEVERSFGFTVERIVAAAREQLGERG